MIEDYLNQTATWEHVTGYSEGFNEPIFATDSIKCRKEEGFKIVRDKTGAEITSSALYLTISNVKVDDKLDGRLVIAVNTMTGLDETEGYEAYTT